jgi:N-methylhydantoinase B
VPGSNASDSTEIFAEGLRIPPLKLYDAGRPNETLFRLIEKNVRVPDQVLGDLHSQMAACAIAEREFLKLVERYGMATLRPSFDALLDYSERVTRAEIAAWPDGRYQFTDHIDDDGIEERPIPIAVTITVRGDELTVDYTGCSRQVKGAINATPSFAKSLAYAAVRSIMDTEVPNNAGYFRPIEVITPPGTIVNPNLPAAFAARGLTGFRMMDALLGALAQIRPERVPAACEGGNTGVSIGGWDAEHGPFIFVEFICGAGGARPGLDGVDGHANPAACMCNVPCEVVEIESPVVIEQYGFVPDTGGAGKHRGGLALVRDYRFVGQEAILQVRSDRRTYLPYGLDGGRPGTPSSNVLNPDGEARDLPSKFTMTIHRGDLLHHVMPGGGGLGHPLDRDPAAVLEDVLDEKLSPEYARREYGVVIDLERRAVDEAATTALRTSLRSPR